MFKMVLFLLIAITSEGIRSPCNSGGHSHFLSKLLFYCSLGSARGKVRTKLGLTFKLMG